MTIRDLPPTTNLENLHVRVPGGTEGYWVSQWPKGVWLKNKLEDEQLHPVFVESLKECLDWEIID